MVTYSGLETEPGDVLIVDPSEGSIFLVAPVSEQGQTAPTANYHQATGLNAAIQMAERIVGRPGGRIARLFPDGGWIDVLSRDQNV